MSESGTGAAVGGILKTLFFSLLGCAFLVSCATQEPERTDMTAWKSAVSFDASVDKSSVETGEAFELTLGWTLPSRIESQGVEPVVPGLKDFERIDQSSYAGRGFTMGDYSSRSYTRIYSLAPKRTGSFVIGPAAIVVEGERFESKPVEIVPSKEAYADALKTNKCEKQFWARYSVGHRFQSLSKKYKISPYEITLGDEHALRNVVVSDRLWPTSHYVDYVSELPEPLRKKYDQAFAAEERKSVNQKSVFDIAVKRDSECYLKMK